MRAKRKTALVVGVVLCLIGIAGCSDAEPTTTETLKQAFLEKVRVTDPNAFANEAAALGYLKNYCEAFSKGVPAARDAIDTIVASYCNTPLATDLGVASEMTPEAEPSVDLEEFRKVALERFDIGKPEADGSVMDAVAAATTLCQADIPTMLDNLGANFKGSFQELALTTFCPEKLP